MTIKMKPAIRKDDAIIISIWEASVRETHDFYYQAISKNLKYN